MRTRLPEVEVILGFALLNIRDLPTGNVWSSEIPEVGVD